MDFCPHTDSNPGLAVFRAEHNVQDNFAEGLWHYGIMDECQPKLNRAFSA
jgi:hypothetical protein